MIRVTLSPIHFQIQIDVQSSIWKQRVLLTKQNMVYSPKFNLILNCRNFSFSNLMAKRWMMARQFIKILRIYVTTIITNTFSNPNP